MWIIFYKEPTEIYFKENLSKSAPWKLVPCKNPNFSYSSGYLEEIVPQLKALARFCHSQLAAQQRCGALSWCPGMRLSSPAARVWHNYLSNQNSTWKPLKLSGRFGWLVDSVRARYRSLTAAYVISCNYFTMYVDNTKFKRDPWPK